MIDTNISKMIVLTIILISAVLIFLFGVYWYQTRSRFARLFNSFPEIESFIPILGHVAFLYTNEDDIFSHFHKFLAKCKETSGGWAGIHGTLHIVTAEDAGILLTNINCIEKGFLYNFLKPWLRSGLLTSSGQKWHQRRKMLTPSFHYNSVKDFIKTFAEHSNNLVEELKEKCGEQKPNILSLVSKMTLATQCETSLGQRFHENDEASEQYLDSVHKYGDNLLQRSLSPWLYPDIMFNLFPIARGQNKLIKYLHSYTNNFIKAKEKQLMDNKEMYINLNKSNKGLKMLDLLFSAKSQNEIYDEGIQEEVDTFIFAGHDTTYIAITFSLLVLANHKDIQDKIIEELDEIFGDSQRDATYDDLQTMKYLECCLKECLRLYPSVPLILRTIREDLPLTNHIAPAGTDIFVHIYNIHRDPRYYPDPEKFDPNRFLPENSKGRNPFAFIPFSAGPRNCIGQKIAMLQLKTVISTIMRNFKMEPIDLLKDLKFILDIVLRIKGPMYIKFIPRNY